jgi:hypothetical protein
LNLKNAVKDAAPAYDWDCTPGRWLLYTILLAIPFPAKVVRPDTAAPIWINPKPPTPRFKHVGGTVTGAPKPPRLPVIDTTVSAEQFQLPLLTGKLFDLTVLPPDACRDLADAWCKLSSSTLCRLGKVVQPLRAAAEAARTAAAPEIPDTSGYDPDDDDDGVVDKYDKDDDDDDDDDSDGDGL